jgi:C4-dicarboxylate transporter, DctM subunit
VVILDPSTSALIATAILFTLLAIRAPVALALLVAGAVGLWLMDGFTLAEITLSRRVYESTSRYVLVVIPFFLAMGVLVKESGIARDLFTVGQRAFRRVPGGLAVGTIFACSAFAAICGSSVATVASIGRIAIEEMRQLGYRVSVAAGAVGAAGTLGVMIPPSIVLVLYGIITGESIGRLLIAGIVPGVLSAVLYSVAVIVRATVRPAAFGTEKDRPIKQTVVRSASASFPFRSLVETAVLVTIVMGGIYTGITTVVEAAALGAAVALALMLLRRSNPRSRLARLRNALLETTQLNAMIFLLLAGSGVFSYFLVSAGMPREVSSLISQVEVTPMVTVVALLLVFIPLGMFLDPISMLLIAVPLMYPVVVADLGFDGIWFGILVVKMTELAMITPPLGLNAYVIAGVADDVSVEDAFAGSLWYVPIDMAVIALLLAFPGIVTWLPGLMS